MGIHSGARAKFHQQRNRGGADSPGYLNVRFITERGDQGRAGLKGPKDIFRKTLAPKIVGPSISNISAKAQPATAPTTDKKEPQTKLPIAAKLPDIERSLRKNDFTIVRAPTGSGKSTEVPRLAAAMLKHSTGTVRVMVPRRLLATGLGHRTAELEGCEVGTRVGYRHALKSQSSPNAKIEYFTDGWMFARELGEPTKSHNIVLLDEFHTRSIPTDLFLALHLKRREQGLPVPRVGILSATINAEELQEHIGDAPIVDCEGRCFPIKEVLPGVSVAEDAVMLARQGKNVLVFLYGWPAIEKVTEEIESLIAREPRRIFDAHGNCIATQPAPFEVMPLHSQLPPEAQQRALKSYDRPKIVLATNCAEVGITIPDIDAVVSSGLVRRSYLDAEGVQTLGIEACSRKEIKQQIGRSGRTKEGTAIVHVDDQSALTEDAPPEIQNVPLENWVLKLLVAGEDIRELSRHLLSPPRQEQIDAAYSVLFTLGLCGREGHKTKLGERVAQLPVGVRSGKMIIKAQEQAKLGVPILPQVIDAAAISEAQGILSGEGDDWRHHCHSGHASDLLAQLEVMYNAPQKIWKEVCEEIGNQARPLPSRELTHALKEVAAGGTMDLLLERPEISRQAERELYERVQLNLHAKGRDHFLSLWGKIVTKYQQTRDHRLSQMGINVPNLQRAVDIRNVLRHRLHVTGQQNKQSFLLPFEQKEIQKCLWSGWIDRLHYRVGKDAAGNVRYKAVCGKLSRQLSKDSVIHDSPFIVGLPLNLGVLGDADEQRFLSLITMTSAVDRVWLKANTPEPISREVALALSRTPEKMNERRKQSRDERFHKPDSHRGRRTRG